MGWWSWFLTAVGVTWLWLAGSGRWWAWGLGICAEGCWIVYAITTKQYGFIVGALAYGAIHARNLWTQWNAITTADKRSRKSSAST